MRFQTSRLLKPFWKVSVFIDVFGRFSADDRRKCIKKYAFSKRKRISVDEATELVWLSFNSRVFAWFQINGKDMKIARHEDAVAMLTGGLSYVTLVVVREKVINKRMLPLSKLQDQSLLNKRLGPKVGYGSKLQSDLRPY